MDIAASAEGLTSSDSAVSSMLHGMSRLRRLDVSVVREMARHVSLVDEAVRLREIAARTEPDEDEVATDVWRARCR